MDATIEAPVEQQQAPDIQAAPEASQDLSPEDKSQFLSSVFGDVSSDTPEEKAAEGQQAPVKPKTQQTQEKPKDGLTEATNEVSEAEDLEDAPKNMSPKAKATWAQNKKEIREYRKQLADLQAQLKEKEATLSTVNPEKLKQLEDMLSERDGKLSEYEKAMQVFQVESSQLFNQEVTQPLNSIIKSAEEIAARHEINPKDFLAALTDTSGQALDELVAGIGERDRLKTYGLAEKYLEVLGKRDELKNEGKGKLDRLQAEEQRRYDENITGQRKAREKEITENLPNIEKKLSKYITTDEEKKTFADALDHAKKDTLWEHPAKVQAYAALMAGIGPLLFKKIDAQNAEISELTKKLTGMRSSSPGAGGGVGPAGMKPEELDDNVDFMDIIKSKIGAR